MMRIILVSVCILSFQIACAQLDSLDKQRYISAIAHIHKNYLDDSTANSLSIANSKICLSLDDFTSDFMEKDYSIPKSKSYYYENRMKLRAIRDSLRKKEVNLYLADSCGYTVDQYPQVLELSDNKRGYPLLLSEIKENFLSCQVILQKITENNANSRGLVNRYNSRVLYLLIEYEKGKTQILRTFSFEAIP